MMQTMLRLIVRRVIHGVFVIWAVLTGVFVLEHLSGDPTVLFVPEGATFTEVTQLRHEMGFDQALPVQYVHFLEAAIGQGFGPSLYSGRTALLIVLDGLPNTLEMAGVAMGLIIIVAIPLGAIAAIYHDSPLDGLATGTAVAGISMPSFWIAGLLIIFFAVKWRLFPTSGLESPSGVVLPSIALALASMGTVMRMARSSMLQQLSNDYVRTARSKGLRSSTIYIKHVLRNSLIPIISVIGLQTPVLLGGAIIIEQVFAYPGMARLATQAAVNRDFPVIEAFVFVISVIVLSVNLVIDILYRLIDPRISDSDTP
jgi:ABC-type dipeptide/oligopeptide/nickel transport system permease component